MLVVTRKTSEAILIDAGGIPIRVVICRVVGGDVRVGIEADRSVVVRREELPPPRPPSARHGRPA